MNVIETSDSTASNYIERFSFPKTSQIIVNFLLARPGHTVLAAYDSDGIAGVLIGYWSRYRPEARIWYLVGRSGAGRYLAWEAIKRARNAGCKRITCEIERDNMDSRALAHHFGTVATIHKNWYGVGRDALVFCLDLTKKKGDSDGLQGKEAKEGKVDTRQT